jgi:hypothetical protein
MIRRTPPSSFISNSFIEASRYEKQDWQRIADDVRGVRRGPPK